MIEIYVVYWQQKRQHRHLSGSINGNKNFLDIQQSLSGGRHLMKAAHYRLFRDRAFTTWRDMTMGLAAA